MRAVLIRESAEHFKLRAETTILTEGSFPNLTPSEIPAAQAQSRLAIFEATQFIFSQLEDGGLLEEGQAYLGQKWGQALIQEFEIPSVSELSDTVQSAGNAVVNQADKIGGAVNNAASAVGAGIGAISGGAPVVGVAKDVASVMSPAIAQGYETGLSDQNHNPIEAAQTAQTVTEVAPVVAGGAALAGAAALAAKNSGIGSGPVPAPLPASKGIPVVNSARRPLKRR